MSSRSFPVAGLKESPVFARPRVGLIGTGGFGGAHLRALRKLHEEGLCRLEAICDPSLAGESGKDAASPDGVARYPGASEMLAGQALDYVVISSPPHLHGGHVRAALDRGAFVYLEKPPVPTIHELEALIEYPRSEHIAVGFQFLEADAFLDLKRKLSLISQGKIRRICASGLWPRPAWYYERAAWAGRLTFGNQSIFDGPLTNAFAHLVHGVFYLAGAGMDSFAAPVAVQGRYLRARPLQGSDFGWLWSKTDSGVEVSVMAGHCSSTLVPWKITVHTDDEVFVLEEWNLPATDRELLVDAHRRTLEVSQGKVPARTRLQDCRGYSLSTCGSFVSAGRVEDFPSSLVSVVGEGSEESYHVDVLAGLVERFHSPDFDPLAVPPWLRLGDIVNLGGRIAIPADFLSQ